MGQYARRSAGGVPRALDSAQRRTGDRAIRCTEYLGRTLTTSRSGRDRREDDAGGPAVEPARWESASGARRVSGRGTGRGGSSANILAGTPPSPLASVLPGSFSPDLRVVGAHRTTHRLRTIQARQNSRTLMLANSQSLDDLRKCANPASAHRSSEIARNCHETYTRIDRTFGSRLGIARLAVF